MISRTLEANSTYKSRNRIVLVGPAQAAPPPEQPSKPPVDGGETDSGSTPGSGTENEGGTTPVTPPVQPDTSTGATWESPRAS